MRIVLPYDLDCVAAHPGERQDERLNGGR